jgi:hypothetical protein
MSLLQNGTFDKELVFHLKEARLPEDPRKIIGRLYQFGCEHGSHHHILVGTVVAIEISDEGGLQLYVSNPRFWGSQLRSLIYANRKWLARIEQDEEGKRLKERSTFEGEFKLL